MFFCNEEVIQSFDIQNQTMVLKEIDINQEILIGGISVDSILLKLDIDTREFKRESLYFRKNDRYLSIRYITNKVSKENTSHTNVLFVSTRSQTCTL